MNVLLPRPAYGVRVWCKHSRGRSEETVHFYTRQIEAKRKVESEIGDYQKQRFVMEQDEVTTDFRSVTLRCGHEQVIVGWYRRESEVRE